MRQIRSTTRLRIFETEQLSRSDLDWFTGQGAKILAERTRTEARGTADHIMTNDTTGASNPVLFTAVFNQNWENVRHVKDERISFMNAYSLISAGVLTLLQNAHTSDLIRTALLLFMTLFSGFGFLTSLRLKTELEECLDKIGVMTTAAKVREFVALGQLEGRPLHYPKFRWLFPVFFAMTTAGFIALILYRVVAGATAG